MSLWGLSESEQLGNLFRSRISDEQLDDLEGTHQLSVGCILLIDTILGLLCDACKEVGVLGERSEETELVRCYLQRLRVDGTLESCESSSVESDDIK